MFKNPAKLLANLQFIFLAVLALWLVINIFQTTSYVLADYPQMPVQDFWRIPQYWADPSTIHWSNLWQQHNEHRIIFPELIDVTDMLLLRGRMYLPIAVSSACYFGIWCVLVWTLYTQRSFESPAREIALLLSGIIITWRACSSVLATPFQLQFTLLQLVSILALVFLYKLSESRRNIHMAAVIAFAAIGTYSSGNGTLMWIVLVAAALLLKLNIRQTLILTIAAICFTGLYFFHYTFLPSQMSINIRHPIKCMAFLLSYFSMPFGGYGLRTYGFKVGAVNLGLMAACFAVSWKRGLLRSRLAIVLFGSYLFLLLSALLTTAGRLDLNDYPFAQAKAFRYVTMPTVSWALLFIALFWLLEKKWSLLIAVGLSICLFIGFRKASGWVEYTRRDAAEAQITAAMLENGIFDPDQVHTNFPSVPFVRAVSLTLEKNRKSLYAKPDHLLGAILLSLHVNPNPVRGKVTRIFPVLGGVEILGWAETDDLTQDHAILFVDHTNRILGFGRHPPAGFPDDAGSWDTPAKLAFIGYVQSAQPGDKLSVYARTSHGHQVQPLNQTIEIPTFTQVESAATPPLPAITWLPDPAWTPQNFPKGADTDPAPPNQTYGTWSPYAAATGTIHSAPFAVPPDNCIVLPVLPGLSPYGQNVELRDADTSQPIVQLPFLDGRSTWTRWRIPIPATVHHLAIFASDQGTGPNEWLAIAPPEHCR